MENILGLLDIAFKAIGAFAFGVLLLAVVHVAIRPRVPKSPTDGLIYGEKKKKPFKIRLRKWMQKN